MYANIHFQITSRQLSVVDYVELFLKIKQEKLKGAKTLLFALCKIQNFVRRN